MPWAAIVPALVAAGGTVASSVISSRSARNAQQQALNSPQAIAETNLINQQAQYGRQAGDISARLFPKYEEGVGYLENYWKKLLGDDNDAAFSAIAPLVRARKQQTEGLLRAADFLPRGGGQGDSYFRIYDDEAGDVLDLLGQARERARSDYAQLIGDVGSRAEGLRRVGADANYGAASLLGAQGARAYQLGEAARGRTAQTVSGIGAAVGPLLIELLRRTGRGGGNDPTSRYPDTPDT